MVSLEFGNDFDFLPRDDCATRHAIEFIKLHHGDVLAARQHTNAVSLRHPYMSNRWLFWRLVYYVLRRVQPTYDGSDGQLPYAR